MSQRKAQKTYQPQIKVLTTRFADMRVGQKMAIGTPELIAQIIQSIPKGSEWSLKQLRARLAQHLKADVACPVTTSIYLRIAIETEVASGRSRFRFPFWRAVAPKTPLFKKLTPAARETIQVHRSREGLDGSAT